MSAGSSKRGVARWAPWVAVLVVVVAALIVGTVGTSEPSDAQRAQNLAETIRCPSCRSQSAASSETPSSKAVRSLIIERIEAGDTDEEIRDYVAGRYGREVLLDPSGSGFSALVWALPAMFVVAAVAGLAIRFLGYRTPALAATDADRRLVDEAMAGDDAGRGAQDPAPAEDGR